MKHATDILRFSQVLSVLEGYFEKELAQPIKDVYWLALEDLDIEQVERAGQLAINTLKFFPKAAELRELIQGNADDAATKAWVTLQNAYHKAGASMSVLFEDGAIAAAMRDTFGGWIACCEAFHPVYRYADDVSWEERQAARLERRLPEGRQIQIGGLSPEMTRAKQKEFETAYRRARREGKTAPAYCIGECEAENKRTVSGWTKGQPIELEDGRKVLRSSVYVQGATGRTVEADFDFHTATLVTPLLELATRKPAKALPPAREVKQLSGSTSPAVSAEEGKRIVGEAVSDLTALMKMPDHQPLSEEQWQARREELKQQASQL